MMERPWRSSSLAREKTAKAPSPLSWETRDAICLMVASSGEMVTPVRKRINTERTEDTEDTEKKWKRTKPFCPTDLESGNDAQVSSVPAVKKEGRGVRALRVKDKLVLLV